MSLPLSQLREKLPARPRWKDILLIALGISLVGMSAYAFREQISRMSAKLQAGATGGETVSVFDVLVDRDGRQYVDILFDRPLGEGLQGQVLAEAPATIDPAIAGTWRWQDTNALRFSPSGGFPIASKYKIELIPERILRPGQIFSGDTELEVVTDKFLVSGVDAEEEVAGKARIAFHGFFKFNYPVDPEILVKHVKLIDPVAGDVPIHLLTSWTSQEIEYRTDPVQKQVEERTAKIVIAKELTPVSGSIPLGDDYEKEVPIGSSIKLVVRGVEASPGDKESTITIRFSSPVEAAVAAKYISFNPVVAFQPAADGTSVTLSGPFAPGATYGMKIGKGLPATDDSSLQEEYEQDVELPDLEATADFESEGIFLSATGNHTVAIQTVNLNGFQLDIDRVYKNNLFFLFNYGGFWGEEFAYEGSEINHALGDRLKSETISVKGPKNKTVTTPITLDRHVPQGERGLFRMVVTKPDDYEGRQRWLLVTDLGAVAKKAAGELMVWVSSYNNLAPVAGAKVTLISDQNQTMGSGTTDGAGLWRMRDADALANRTPYMVLIEKGDDWSFLLLDEMQTDTTGLDVGGAEPAGEGYDAYLFGERNLYRPGEKLEGLAVVRDGDLEPSPAMPALLRWRDPEGKERSTQRITITDRGLSPFSLQIPAYATTGRHSLEMEVAEKVIGSYAFSVEDFVPDRIKVEISGAEKAPKPGENLTYKVQSNYLFGPPSSGLAVESRVRLADATFSPKGFEAYSFRNDDRKLEDRELLNETGKLDAEGGRQFSIAVPDGLPVPSTLEAIVTARVQEQGGRGVSALQRLKIHPYPYYLGLKRPNPDAFAEIGKDQSFDWIAVSAEGKETASAALRAELYFDRWNTVLRRTDEGTYRWESTRDPVLVQTLPVASGKTRGSFRFRPAKYGSYRVVLSDPATLASTQVEFYASGWGYSPWGIKNPTRLELDLDKEEYAPGDTATIQIRAPFPGKVLLTVEREKIFFVQSFDLAGNTGKVTIPVDGSWRPNAYVTATLVRKAKDLEAGSAARAFGAVPIAVDRVANKLQPGIVTPAEMRPESPVSIEVQTRPGAVVTLAAVDEGILQLIAQKTPQPFDFFYRKLALSVDSYDTFGVLLPEVAPEGTKAKGGGEGGEGLSQYVRTEGIRRTEPVAFWSGPVTADANGKVRLTFQVPEFQGALRIMAVAIDGRKFGSSEKLMRVRTPVAVLPTFPRVLSFGENLKVPVTVRNDTGRAGTFQVNLTAQGPAKVAGGAQSLQLGNAKDGTLYFDVESGAGAGDIRFVASASGNGESGKSSAYVPVRADLFPIATEQAGAMQEDEIKLKVDDDGLREETIVRTVRIGSGPLVQFTGKLSDLLRYPYGCAEQTVSSAFPLLYMGDLAKELEPELFDPKKGRGDPAVMVQDAVRRLSSMQLFNGGFTLWPGGQQLQPWASVYVAHFLVEARRAGHPVEDFLYDGALRWIGSDAKAKSAYGQEELQRIAYELFVLARAGKADLGTMDFLREKQMKALRPESRSLLAGAYASVGNARAAGDLVANLAEVEKVNRQTGGNWNSEIRNRAITLMALLDAQPSHPRVAQLVDRLARDAREIDTWNTQESGFAFVALGQFYKRQAEAPPFTGTLYVGGKKIGTFTKATSTFRNIKGTDPVRIEMDKGYKAGSAFYSVVTRAIPTDKGFKPESAGLEVEREILTRDGKAADLGNVAQGDLLVVKTRVRSVSGPLLNVAIVSLLASGVEVENPRLETTEQLPWVNDANLRAVHQDLRDDRFLLFTDLPANSWQTFYTLVRAVAPGTFRLPPVHAEAMYNPALRGTSPKGEVTVKVRQ